MPSWSRHRQKMSTTSWSITICVGQSMDYVQRRGNISPCNQAVPRRPYKVSFGVVAQ